MVGFLGRLVRDPGWLVGYALNGLGFVGHIVALHLGAIAVVQAVLVLQLLFALLIAASRRRPWRCGRPGRAPVLGIAASSSVGMLLMQDAFASGSMPTALTAMTITDPVCSAVVGALIFDATPPLGWELGLGLPLSGVLVVTGVVLLATSTTLHDERHLYVPRPRRDEPPAAAQAAVGVPTSDACTASSSDTVRSQG